MSSPVVEWNSTLNETLVYVANEAGYVIAFAQATGAQVWSVNFRYAVRSTPLAAGNDLWVAPAAAHRIYKLDAGTGAVQCSAPLPINTDASPVLATPPGGSPTIYMGVNDNPSSNGPLVAVNEATCAADFSVTPEPKAATGGIWNGISYGVDATGEGLVLFGTSDPDSAVYAVDAITGATVWRYATQNPPPGDFDLGAGVTISPPGVNGFADGVAYAVNKDGYVDAIDLTTGRLLWTVQYGATISTPSLAGTSLVFGQVNGQVVSLDARTGALVWQVQTGAGIDGGPAIVGPPGSQVVAVGNLAGSVQVLSLSSGSLLYSHPTGNFIVGGAADVDGSLIEVSADGYVYEFRPGGGNNAASPTAITSPVDGSTGANPNGPLVISGIAGTASGPAIGAVEVAVQQGGAGGTWWNATSQSWVAAPYGNLATLTTPGGPSSGWTLSLPVPAAGGQYEAFASTVSTDGVADISAFQAAPTSARSSFTIQSSGTAPLVTLSARFIASGNVVKASGSGFGAGEQVNISIDATLLATAQATSTGTLPSTSLKIPVGTPFGPSSIVATGQLSGLQTAASAYITNAWSQFQGGPARTGFEPNDPVLADHLSVSPSTFLAQAWSFTSSAPIRTSSAVVQGVAYFANDAGTIYAVTVQTGRQLWAQKVGGGLPLNSSPAVDPGTDGGIVVVGTGSGSVVALSMATGSQKWVTSLGATAIESSPAVAQGTVFVGSDAGVLYALNENNGSVIWETTLAGPVHSSPAIDITAKIVVVGDNSGAITALSSQTGLVQWKVATAGAVTGTPAISGSRVYVGSADTNVYALDETSGTKVWTFKMSGPVTASVAVGGSTVEVGDGAGLVEWLSTAGSKTFTHQLGGAIVGMASAQSFAVAVTAAGGVDGAKTGGGAWTTQIGSSSASSPTIINGEVFVTGEDGALRCYTVPGSAPV